MAYKKPVLLIPKGFLLEKSEEKLEANINQTNHTQAAEGQKNAVFCPW